MSVVDESSMSSRTNVPWAAASSTSFTSWSWHSSSDSSRPTAVGFTEMPEAQLLLPDRVEHPVVLRDHRAGLLERRDRLAERVDRGLRAARRSGRGRWRCTPRASRPRCSGPPPGRRSTGAPAAGVRAIRRSVAAMPAEPSRTSAAEAEHALLERHPAVEREAVAGDVRRASSESRNSAAQTTSSSVPKRRCGIASQHRRADLLGREQVGAWRPGVSTGPGAIALTRMPSGAHSTARVRVRFRTPAFAAAEWAVPGLPVLRVGRDDVQDRAAAAGVAQPPGERPSSSGTSRSGRCR